MVAGVELETAVTDESWLFLIDRVQPVIRLTAVLVVAAATWMFLRPHRVAHGFLALAAIASTGLPLGYLVHPHRISPEGQAMRDAATWLGGSAHADAPALSASIWGAYFLDRGRNVIPPESPDILADTRPGTVFLWDAVHAVHPRFGLTVESMRDQGRWHVVWESDQRVGGQPAGRIYVKE
jgi:hypothetical protein